MNRISVFYEHIAEAAAQSGQSLQTVCNAVKGFGFDAVELDADRLLKEGSAVLSALKSAGLGVNCIYYFFDFGRDEDHLEGDLAEAEKITELCVSAECDKLLLVAGFLTENETDRSSEAYHARRGRMAKSAAQLVLLAAGKGITVVMEDFDSNTAPFSTAEELLWFMENAPGLRCGFDTGNFLYSEEDAAAVLPQFLPYISAVHCKDRSLSPNDGVPKETVSSRKMYPVAVGDGDLPMKSMVRTILEAGYTGTFAAEHFDSKHQLRDMERSAAWLRKILGEQDAQS